MRTLLILVVVLLVAGCATHRVKDLQYTVYRADLDNIDVLTAATVVLQNHGYTIAMVNEKIGVLTTDWRDMEPGPAALFAGFDERDKLNLSIVVETAVIKPVCQIRQGFVWKNRRMVTTKIANEYEQIVYEINSLLKVGKTE